MAEAYMAKKKSGGPKVPATASPKVRHARVELPPEVYNRLETAAEKMLLPITAYLRIALMEKLTRDEAIEKGRADR